MCSRMISLVLGYLCLLQIPRLCQCGYFEDDLDYISKVFPEETKKYCPNLPYYGGFLALAGEAAVTCPMETFEGFEVIEETDLNYQPFYAPIPTSVKEPVILLWTHRLTNKQGYIKQCPKHSCLITENRNWINNTQTKAVLFYGTAFKLTDLPLPRREGQLWALIHEESPKNAPAFSYSQLLELFNLTSTFKQQSDLPLTTQYLRSAAQLTSTTHMKSSAEKNRLRREGLAPVIYVQSDCDVPSDRDRIVKWLMKYIQIDSYGKCLHNKDLPAHLDMQIQEQRYLWHSAVGIQSGFEESTGLPIFGPTAYRCSNRIIIMNDAIADNLTDAVNGMDHPDFIELVSQYKFAIAMENGVCDDYITEKLWRPLAVGTVPITYGTPNLQDWLPDNKSAIRLEEFNTIEELVVHIKYLDVNDTAYQEYRQFKQNEGITNEKLKQDLTNRAWEPDFDCMGVNHHGKKGNYINHFDCYICDKIHELIEGGEKMDYRPLSLQASKSHYGCPLPEEFVDPKNLSRKAPFSEFWHSAWLTSYCEVTSMHVLSEGGRKWTSSSDIKVKTNRCLRNPYLMKSVEHD